MKTLHFTIIAIMGIGVIVTAYLPNVYAPCAIGQNGTQFCAGIAATVAAIIALFQH